MNLQTKLCDPKQSVYLYGTTPPRANATEKRIHKAATKLTERVNQLPVDGIVVYDIQDEEGRTDDPRPFPYIPTIDSREYSKRLQDLTGLPTITYKSIGDVQEPSWAPWLTETSENFGINFLSLVGKPTSDAKHTSISLSRATRLAAAHPSNFMLGGVVIAERHSPERSESARLLRKSQNGCKFFISQAVYDASTTIRMLDDYYRSCRQQSVEPSRIILTFIPCGREKTIEFINWLGIAMPQSTVDAILNASDPLAKSIEISCNNLRSILDHEYAEHLPLGINVESVSINKAEIEASVDLFHGLQDVMEAHRRTVHSA